METEEFNIRVLPHRDMIFRLAKSMLCDVCEAEDATQDILEKLWRRRTSFSACDNIGAVIYTATRNHCIDRIRARKTCPGGFADIDRVAEHGADMMSGIEGRDLKRAAEAIIARLPGKQRMVIHLRDVEGYEFSEMAAITGVDESTLRVLLSRARKSVREKLLKIMNHGTT